MKIDMTTMTEQAVYIRIKPLAEGERIARSVPLHDLATIDTGIAKNWQAMLGDAYIVCDLNDAGELLGIDITL